MLTVAAATEDVANTTYLWLYVILGLIVFVGGGGIYGLIRWVKRQGVRDSKLDEVIDPEKGIFVLFAALQSQVADLQKTLKPNGLNTNQLGDVVKRTENAVNEMASKLDQHIGASDQTHKDLWEAVGRSRIRGAS